MRRGWCDVDLPARRRPGQATPLLAGASSWSTGAAGSWGPPAWREREHERPLITTEYIWITCTDYINITSSAVQTHTSLAPLHAPLSPLVRSSIRCPLSAGIHPPSSPESSLPSPRRPASQPVSNQSLGISTTHHQPALLPQVLPTEPVRERTRLFLLPLSPTRRDYDHS